MTGRLFTTGGLFTTGRLFTIGWFGVDVKIDEDDAVLVGLVLLLSLGTKNVVNPWNEFALTFIVPLCWPITVTFFVLIASA